MTDTASLAKKAMVILTNEIVPRARKCGMTPNEFCPPQIAGALARLEVDGELTRRDVRNMLDKLTAFHRGENG